jgi:hypothetical protein
LRSADLNYNTMNISPFRRGDYITVRHEYFEKEGFDPATSPLRMDEVGIVTRVSTSGGDKRPRFIEVNGAPPLYHFSMFEATSAPLLQKLRLRLKQVFSLRR